MRLLPCAASWRARRGFVPLHLPGSLARCFRRLWSQPVRPGACRPHAQSRLEHCAQDQPKGTKSGIASSLLVAQSHPSQCERGAGNITGLRMCMINISILLCLFPLPPSTPFILDSFAEAPGLGWALSPQPNLNKQHQNQCQCPGFTSVEKQRSLFLKIAWLPVLSLLLPAV